MEKELEILVKTNQKYLSKEFFFRFCDGCGKGFVRPRGLIWIEGKRLCASCRHKLPTYKEMFRVASTVDGNTYLKLKKWN